MKESNKSLSKEADRELQKFQIALKAALKQTMPRMKILSRLAG